MKKLRERHGIVVAKETLRKWMTEAGLWIPHIKRRDRVHQPRRRRECVGELIQIDGCDHEWFEDRAARCVLLVFIDDATSRLMEMHFCEGESTFAYFTAARKYLGKHGKPVAFYSDKATVFRSNRKEPVGGAGVTQFGRAMTELNVDIICANTAPAKGRVERAHQTLQDRLVKELRLRGISSIEEANAFAEEFRADYNRRFAKPPRNDFNAHRPLAGTEDLDAIFKWQEQRKVSKNLTFNYRRVLYVIRDCVENRALAGKHVAIYEAEDGSVRVWADSRSLRVTTFAKDESRVPQGAIVSNKLLGPVLAEIEKRQQAQDLKKLGEMRLRRDRRLLEARAAAAQ